MSNLLKKLKNEIGYEKLTVSFSLEGRDSHGVKKFSLFTVSVGKQEGGAWSPGEMPIIKALISRQVVATTYKDALQRGAISKALYKDELPVILKGLDDDIERQVARLGEGEGDGH